ncbi:hypothetical protein GALMADRAFT_272507 [Galerina marginata CBS 339.88]|uniref:Uncharacterized protein n=1 Tax=Galerina marginata (strain CBS 339.88) TaxID=685588 RepID=A0A067SLL0_GALM3|nr:hypothetical protein GALMADRAFT_272507 [Galerina marginata CBS 339.88]
MASNSGEENKKLAGDIAEDFVSTFYHDSGDEVNTDEEEEGNLFDLYNNSRPLTPLAIEDGGVIEYSNDDSSRHISDVDFDVETSMRPRNEQRLSTSTVKADRRDSNEVVQERQSPADLTSETETFLEDPPDMRGDPKETA